MAASGRQQAAASVALLLLPLVLHTVVDALESPASAIKMELMAAIDEAVLMEAVDHDGRYDQHLCAAQLKTTLKAIGAGELWALKMLDSWGKIPSGILNGNSYELGDFDTCMQVHNDDANIHSQYCLALLHPNYANSGIGSDVIASGIGANKINDRIKMMVMDGSMMSGSLASVNGSALGLFVAFCMPATCSPAMQSRVFDGSAMRLRLPLDASVTEQLCTRSPLVDGGVPLSALDIVAITVLGCLAVVMIASTLYDLYATDARQSSILTAFSIYTNGQNLFQRKPASAYIYGECCKLGFLNGLRVLSIVWVVFAHTVILMCITPLINPANMTERLDSAESVGLVLSAGLAVDTFFLLSGLLVTFWLLKYLDHSNGRLNLCKLYLHRYLRLTPSLAAAILTGVTLLSRLGDGPLWNTYMKMAEAPCRRWWWTSLLYVQNYANPDDFCMWHTWYLSADMQLYLVAPALVWPIWRYRGVSGWLGERLWVSVPAVLAVASMAATFGIWMANGISGRLETQVLGSRRMELTYYPTHCRIGAWLIGVIVGYVLHDNRFRTEPITKCCVTVGWTLSVTTMFTVIFANYLLQSHRYSDSVLAGAIFESVSRVAWAGAVGWLVFACANGYGGPVDWFLSLDVWQPLARLSYTIYLMHPAVSFIISAQMRVPNYFSVFSAITMVCTKFGMTLPLAVLWTLAFESPMLVLERLWLSGGGSDSGAVGSTIDCKDAAQKRLDEDNSSDDRRNGHRWIWGGRRWQLRQL